MIFIVASPDKLSMSMFMSFFTDTYMQNVVYQMIDINCLYSADIQEGILKEATDALKAEENILIKYKTKKNTVYENLPEFLYKSSDYFIQFDLFSMHVEVLKAQDDVFIKEVVERWEKNVEKLNKT